MIKTYALIAPNGKPLALPLLTLRDAEKYRDTLATMGKTVTVVNARSE
jgi:hypothetical protein